MLVRTGSGGEHPGITGGSCKHVVAIGRAGDAMRRVFTRGSTNVRAPHDLGVYDQRESGIALGRVNAKASRPEGKPQTFDARARTLLIGLPARGDLLPDHSDTGSKSQALALE